MNDLYERMAKDLKEMPRCEICNLLAVSEWKMSDEDGTYYTYRCEEHPETNPNYQEIKLYGGE